MPKLSHWQSKALGSEAEPLIWNQKVSKLYKKPHPCSLEDDDPTISQSYDEFIEYGSRLPNEEGTGRFIPGYDNRDTIYVLQLKGSDKVDDLLVEFLSTYFCVKVELLMTELTMNITKNKSKKRSFDDLSGNVSYPLRSNIKSEVDVFSIFDVIVDYLPRNAYTAVLLLDSSISLCENNESIYGRACGDRVAVVSSSGIGTTRELFTVIVHELLHTFGVDHCESFACIMNPCRGESHPSALELCPSELRKLSAAVPHFKAGIVKRWEKLSDLCERLGWERDAAWYKERLRLSGAV
jgi:predicted Zn-dependent protease